MKIKTLVTVAAVAVAVSQTCLAVMPASLPDFKSGAEVRQGFGKSKSAGVSRHSETFYTGKPYESSRNGYVFQYRNYNPELSRWNCSDPSGFPDGANNTLYAANPCYQLDPDGLDTVTVTGIPQTGSNGTTLSIVVDEAAHQVGTNIQGRMKVHWTIDGNFTGWVVQQVQFDYSSIFNDSDGSAWTVPSPPTSMYWEAWRVTNGTVEHGGSDTFQTRIFPESTHGSVTITGKVDFYRDSVIPSDDPSGWGSVPEAGVLLATTTQPSWWNGSGFNHKLEMSWE